VLDSIDGHALQGATVFLRASVSGLTRSTVSSEHGEFALISLPPGSYSIQVSAAGYQPQELREFEISVASINGRDFLLRPLSDVWEGRQKRNLQALNGRAVLPLIGPDMGTGYEVNLASRHSGAQNEIAVVSNVVDREQIQSLTITGRDVYSLLIGLGGINSDSGSGRGLGLTVAGQRPSSSSFRLDGFENDNRLTTGPAVELPPEAIGEFRVSLAQYQAEYGGMPGYLANAVTREPGSAWHGSVFGYLQNRALDANSFARNRMGQSRPGHDRVETGFAVGGPVRVNDRLFLLLDGIQNREEGDPQTIEMPAASYLQLTGSRSAARSLLDRFPAPLPRTPLASAPVEFQPVYVRRGATGILRLDQQRAGGRLRVFERGMFNRSDQPDFFWSPYQGLVSPLRQDAVSGALAVEWSPSAHVQHEFRAGYGANTIGWPRPFPGIPTLTGYSATNSPLALPASTLSYGFHDQGRRWELAYQLGSISGRHLWKTGASILFRRDSGSLTFGRDGRLTFPDVLSFYLDAPDYYERAIDRSVAAVQTPAYESQFAMRDAALFAQDDWRATQRLTISVGVRYESFGAPQLIGDTHLLEVATQPGRPMPETLAAAQLKNLGAGSTAYTPDRVNFASRTGVAWRPGRGSLVARASFSIFYDRPFDNLWQNLRNNNVQLESFTLEDFGLDYLVPPSSWLNGRTRTREDFPELLMYQPGFRTAYSQNHMAGLRSRAGDWEWEVNEMGSSGRLLVTSDRINRPNTLPPAPGNSSGFLNSEMGTVVYRGNQGSSTFEGMNLVLRRRTHGLLLQASYTWSHAIDNQSDPLLGDFFDLGFSTVPAADALRAMASFSKQFDSAGDRGNSDFDQRHNLVITGSWQLPKTGMRIGRALQDWRISWLATFRSGQPVTIFAQSGDPASAVLYNQRADYLGGPVHSAQPIDGGVQWFSAAAFAVPAPGVQGNLGRNSLRSAGLYSADASVARSFNLPHLGEGKTVTFRTEFFNALNHANLDRPVNSLGDPAFGTAGFGRHGSRLAFPGSVPLDESPRRIQLSVSVTF
jgi:hypothetical protein